VNLGATITAVKAEDKFIEAPEAVKLYTVQEAEALGHTLKAQREPLGDIVEVV